jgi:hypothetical protein
MHRNNERCYSITSSAAASSVGAFEAQRIAVLRLSTGSNLGGCSTAVPFWVYDLAACL